MPLRTISARPLVAEDALAGLLAAIPADLGVDATFPPEALAEAEHAVAAVELPDRDLTDLPFVTIDPPGSTDLDQAMHLAREGAGYRVLYAIADVPAFVAPGGALDAEARRRGQTIYAPTGRVPLHPPAISESAASLLPGQIRSAYLWDLLLDEEGEVTSVTVGRARMRSTAQLDYAAVQESIDAGSADHALLREIGILRVALEEARGGASLRVPETEVALVDGRYVIERRSPLPVEEWNAQLSLMTGMAAARIMLDGGVGILRTMPEADEEAVARFRRQATGLGTPWPDRQRYGDYLRGLDPAQPQHLAIMHAAASLFRGAGYTAFDGAAPEQATQAAVAAPYAHVTAPLRRLVDRFGLVVCAALSAGEDVPAWVRAALPELPRIMASTGALAGQVDARALDVVEAALLAPLVGTVVEATVLSAGKGTSTVQLAEPPVTARAQGELAPGATVRLRVDAADPVTATVVLVSA